jgi:hypothetical protein
MSGARFHEHGALHDDDSYDGRFHLLKAREREYVLAVT